FHEAEHDFAHHLTGHREQRVLSVRRQVRRIDACTSAEGFDTTGGIETRDAVRGTPCALGLAFLATCGACERGRRGERRERLAIVWAGLHLPVVRGLAGRRGVARCSALYRSVEQRREPAAGGLAHGRRRRRLGLEPERFAEIEWVAPTGTLRRRGHRRCGLNRRLAQQIREVELFAEVLDETRLWCLAHALRERHLPALIGRDVVPIVDARS